MKRLEIENTTEDEFQRDIERSVNSAVQEALREMRETVQKLERQGYLLKNWLTLEEAARYADITTATLRGWRENGLEEAEVEGRIYIRREELDSFIASHV